MASTLKSFPSRRYRNVAILIVIAACVLAADNAFSKTLRDSAFISGWILLALVVVLTLYNARKKLPFLPLGSSAGWLQLHAYAGLLSGLLFCVHVSWRIPNGAFELVFAFAFWGVFLSGVGGLVISRVFARRMGSRGYDVLYSRIPRSRNRLRAHTEQRILDCTAKTESNALLEFYADRLKPFFDGPSNAWYHLMLSDRPIRRLHAEIQGQAQFLNEGEREYLDQIVANVQEKNELDFHYAHQTALKYWLFFHVPLTYAMLAFAAVHVVLVHAFWS